MLVIIELALGLEEILETVYSILYWTLVFKKNYINSGPREVIDIL